MSLENLRLAFGRNLKFINPNILYVLALLVSLEAGYCFLDANKQQYLYIWIAVLMLLRLAVNWTSKQIVLARGAENKKSYSVYYRLSDIVSELFIISGFTIFSAMPGSFWYLKRFAFLSVLLVMFTGLMGKAAGLDYAKQGPMCKLGRQILIIITILVQYFMFKYASPFIIFNLEKACVYSWMDAGLSLLILLALVTFVRRLLAIRKQIKQDETKEW